MLSKPAAIILVNEPCKGPQIRCPWLLIDQYSTVGTYHHHYEKMAAKCVVETNLR